MIQKVLMRQRCHLYHEAGQKNAAFGEMNTSFGSFTIHDLRSGLESGPGALRGGGGECY